MWSEGVYIIAEAGSNHDGDLNQAADLINVAAEAGCDAIKFQCLPSLPHAWMPKLQTWAKDMGIDFLATPFDVDAVKELDALDVPAIKIASPELVNLGLIEAATQTDRPLILSTGMATLGDVEQALDLTAWRQGQDVALLQCTTSYPASPETANLKAMDTMRQAFGFGIPVGLSDHTLGIAVPIAAAALGASVIEKHFTLSRELEGPDHAFALEPDELKAMVEGIREAQAALGDGLKDGPRDGEMAELRGRRLTWES